LTGSLKIGFRACPQKGRTQLLKECPSTHTALKGKKGEATVPKNECGKPKERHQSID